MAKFKPLVDSSVKDAESQVSEYWKQINILDRTLEKGQNDPSFVFYEGPPTANGNPGIHHVVARTLKDWVCRYKTMSGYQVKRKAGWDTHGLPVELQVEKELGLTNKQQIEEYGIAEFNQKCRESVFTYENKWRNMTERMAYEVDLDNPYITLDNNYTWEKIEIVEAYKSKKGYLPTPFVDYILQLYENKTELEIDLSKNLTLIATIGSNAPYVGLLGTVFGIIMTFVQIGQLGMVDTANIMTGLALALQATAGGLLVAIPSIIFYNLLMRKSEVLIAQWEILQEKKQRNRSKEVESF